PAAPPAPSVPPARTDAESGTGPGHTALAQQDTRTALTPPKPVVPPPARPGDTPVTGGGSGADTTTPTVATGPAPAERRFRLTADRVIGLLGILVSGAVVLGYQEVYEDSLDGLVGVWAVAAVLGLALFRWLPLASTVLWWGAGALVAASITIGGGVYDYEYQSVTESDFSTLYYYDTSYQGYYELPTDSSGNRLFEDDYSGGYAPAETEVSHYYTAHDNVEILAAPLLVLAALCLFRALSRRHLSSLAAACGLTLGGLGVGWLAFGDDEQASVFAVVWLLLLIAAVVQEIRARRNPPPPARRRLRFVTAD
ncbi:hypothetical protein JTP77_033145, partial [Streptomyces sp. S9]|nr:hypothetical protein [Streptomyces sp. S9]